MRIHWPLLWWQFRQTLPFAIKATVVLAVYVLFCGEPLQFHVYEVPALIVFAHCLAIAWRMGRVRSPAFAYLYIQGYSRGVLWGHTMLASLASVLMMWLPMAALIWLPIRSSFQDTVFQNACFPFMGPTERSLTLWCLATYFCLIPIFHYAWIRSSLPMRGVVSGHVLAAATVVALLSFWLGVPQWLRFGWPSIAIVGMFSSAAFVLLLVGWRVHYRMEVRG